MKYLVHNAEETWSVASEFVQKLKPAVEGATIVGLYGDLGAGKTTFTQGVARALGVEDQIVSPTFVIEKIYELPIQNYPFFHLIHIDAYRLESSQELVTLGWNEIISRPTNLILIEWPERVADIMPLHPMIRFATTNNPDEREIEIG